MQLLRSTSDAVRLPWRWIECIAPPGAPLPPLGEDGAHGIPSTAPCEGDWGYPDAVSAVGLCLDHEWVGISTHHEQAPFGIAGAAGITTLRTGADSTHPQNQNQNQNRTYLGHVFDSDITLAPPSDTLSSRPLAVG